MNTRPEEKLLKISKNFPLLSQLKIHRILLGSKDLGFMYLES